MTEVIGKANCKVFADYEVRAVHRITDAIHLQKYIASNHFQLLNSGTRHCESLRNESPSWLPKIVSLYL